MDNLISRKATDNPQEFSKRMNLSKRSLMGYLQAMRFWGFPVKYDKKRGTYFYKENWKVYDALGKAIDKKEQKTINGQMSSEEREKCADALHENNNEKIADYCSDLFID